RPTVEQRVGQRALPKQRCDQLVEVGDLAELLRRAEFQARLGERRHALGTIDQVSEPWGSEEILEDGWPGPAGGTDVGRLEGWRREMNCRLVPISALQSELRRPGLSITRRWRCRESCARRRQPNLGRVPFADLPAGASQCPDEFCSETGCFLRGTLGK